MLLVAAGVRRAGLRRDGQIAAYLAGLCCEGMQYTHHREVSRQNSDSQNCEHGKRENKNAHQTAQFRSCLLRVIARLLFISCCASSIYLC
jgi:hypothetical protein